MTNHLNSKKQDVSQAKYLVSFISLLSSQTKGYIQAANEMMAAVKLQKGFIAAYSARNQDGMGITNSYWSDLEAITHWKTNQAHQAIQDKGKATWYQWYQVQVCEIHKSYD